MTNNYHLTVRNPEDVPDEYIERFFSTLSDWVNVDAGKIIIKDNKFSLINGIWGNPPGWEWSVPYIDDICEASLPFSYVVFDLEIIPNGDGEFIYGQFRDGRHEIITSKEPLDEVNFESDFSSKNFFEEHGFFE